MKQWGRNGEVTVATGGDEEDKKARKAETSIRGKTWSEEN